MPSGVGLEVVLVFVLLAMLVVALFVGRRLRERPIPVAPRRKGAGLASRLGRLAGKERLTDEDWRWLEETLVRADTGRRAAAEVVTRVRERYDSGQDPVDLLAQEVEHVFAGDAPLSLPDDLAVVMVVGVNGTGKTTTIGKLAHWLRSKGRSVAVANSDTFRAAAAEQLGEWAGRARADLVAQQRGADPGAVAFDAVQAARARHRDVLIVDTAGRLHSKQPLMDELAKVKRVLESAAGKPPDEVLLVVDATTGQNGLAQARAFTGAVGVTGVVLTKLDGTARGGIVLAVREELGIPVKLVGTGEGLDDLEPFDPTAFAESLVRT
jgi:fused signal recognition particle receptor